MQIRRPLYLRAWDWVDNRYQASVVIDALMHVEIPRSARTFFFGGITMFFFMVQAVTGILLAIYYKPTPDTAYDSILFIMNQASFGWLIRSIHSWSANLMIFFCVLHLLRVFFQGVYKKPREMTWGAGVILLVLTLGFGFTGYLLPWDQRAYWASTIGSEIAGAMPGIGDVLLNFIFGGADISATTLSRFFGFHVLVFPVSLALVLVMHLTMVHQQGLADPTADSAELDLAEPAEAPAKKKKLLPFFPNYVLDEVIAWYAMLAVLIILASIFPSGLEEPADPLHTPEHSKPEWYFLFLYQALKVVPRTVGVLLPVVGGVILLALPFLDRNPSSQFRKRPVAVGIGMIIVVAIIVFTIWGYIS